MEELQVIVNQTPGKIEFNFEEIRDALDTGNFAEYKEMRLAGFAEGKINGRV